MSVAGGGCSHFHRLLLGIVNQGDKIYRFDESGEKASAKPESLGRLPPIVCYRRRLCPCEGHFDSDFETNRPNEISASASRSERGG